MSVIFFSDVAYVTNDKVYVLENTRVLCLFVWINLPIYRMTFDGESMPIDRKEEGGFR